MTEEEELFNKLMGSFDRINKIMSEEPREATQEEADELEGDPREISISEIVEDIERLILFRIKNTVEKSSEINDEILRLAQVLSVLRSIYKE